MPLRTQVVFVVKLIDLFDVGGTLVDNFDQYIGQCLLSLLLVFTKKVLTFCNQCLRFAASLFCNCSMSSIRFRQRKSRSTSCEQS